MWVQWLEWHSVLEEDYFLIAYFIMLYETDKKTESIEGLRIVQAGVVNAEALWRLQRRLPHQTARKCEGKAFSCLRGDNTL